MDRKSRHALLVPVCLAACLLAAPAAPAADWASWRGPNQDGTTLGNGVFEAERFGLDVAWSRPLGIAYSGIAVSDGRAVTMFGDGEHDWVTAVDPTTGEELWRYRIDSMFPKIGGSDGGPVSMPVIDEGVVFGLGAKGHLFALNLEDGAKIWALRIDEVVGAQRPRFGFTTAPLVVGDLLFVQTGGTGGRSFTGFDKKTGDVSWTTGDDPIGYQSPILASLAGREQIVAVSNASVHGLDPETGAVLWTHEHGTSDGDGYATPVLLGDDRFLIPGMNESAAFRLERDDGGYEVEEIWRSSELKRSFATPVLHDGRLYGFAGDFLTCVDPGSGEKLWKSRPPGGRGLIVVDGHLVVFGADGHVVVAAASAERYEEKARVKVSDHGSYTYPSFSNGTIFVRNIHDFAGVRIRDAVPGPGDLSGGIEARNAFERFVRTVEESEIKRILIDDFMNHQRSFPIIEDDRWVHFVYRGEAEDVAITGSMTELQLEEPLARIEGTDLYYRSYSIEPAARWEYRLNVDFENMQPDPLNPRRVPSDEGDLSEVATSGWKAPSHVRPYAGSSPGRMDRFTLESEILGNERQVDVYLPPGYDDTGRSYPLLVINDGKPWLEQGGLPNSLNNLIGNSVAPILVAFVERPRRTARDEFGGERSDDYVRMLADELVPYLDERYRTLARADARAILGNVRGALMAAYAALQRPDVFGKSAGCSVYLAAPLGQQLVESLEGGGESSEARFWLGWNRYEMHRAEWDFDLARDTKRLTEAMRAAGIEVAGGEVLDAAGWGSWRVRAGEILETFFPQQ